jgi:hypothetical protein
MRKRRAVGMASGALALLFAADALAWSPHRLYARGGSDTESTTSVDVTSVEALSQFGVPGVDDYAYFAHASANSDSGVLLAETTLDMGPPGNVFDFYTVGAIEQWLEVEDVGQPITVTFRLLLDLASQRTGTITADAAGRLDVGDCGLYVEVRQGEDPELIDNCTTDFPYLSFETSLGAGALQIAATYASGHVPSAIDFLAQVENEVRAFTATATAQTLAGGALSVSVEGAGSHSFASPTFLSVPEPGGAMLGAAALGALALSTRRAPA